MIVWKSSLILYEEFPKLKYKYWNLEFRRSGYFVDTARKNNKNVLILSIIK
jgi:putative transposase